MLESLLQTPIMTTLQSAIMWVERHNFQDAKDSIKHVINFIKTTKIQLFTSLKDKCSEQAVVIILIICKLINPIQDRRSV